MRKISILALAILILLGVVVLIVGIDSIMLTGNDATGSQDKDNSRWHFEPKAQEPEAGTAAETAVLLSTPAGNDPVINGRAVFSDISHALQGNRITLEGYIYDSKTKNRIPKLPFAVYCNGRVISDPYAKTDPKGFFYITPDSECTGGDEAWLQTMYNGKEYESDHIFIPKRIIRHSSHRTSSSSSGEHVVAVPEFSTITLALAVMLVTLGLAFLRKH